MTTMTGAHFRALRTYLGYSVTELADYLGTSPDSTRSWDAGRRPIPAGVVEELHELQDATERAVGYLVRHYEAHPDEWPMVIPRTSEDADDHLSLMMPGPVTVDWWKHVGARVYERVPGLTLDWG